MTTLPVKVLALLSVTQFAATGVVGQSKEAVETATEQTQSGIGDALMTPISDLNLKRKEIPQVLLSLESAYDPLPDTACETLAATVMELELVIGPDINDSAKEEQSKGEKIGSSTSRAALDTISSTTGGLIPLRGVVRTVSGAAKRERQLIAAIRKGFERRAFIKGMGTQLGCEWPASPREAARE